jgi:hypothetical protein
MSTEPRELELRLAVGSDEELAELEKALLKARATELAEVRRQNLRFNAGYGDATGRDVMDEVARLARVRHDVLSRLLEALRKAAAADR